MPSVEVDITKLFVRDAPLYHAMSTEDTVFVDPRFAVINDPTPRLDHLVPRLLSNAFEGTLPSLPLAVTEVGVNTGSVGIIPATVNVHNLSAPIGAPAASVTLPAILAVYKTPAAKFEVGFRVATVLPEPMVTVAGTGVPPLVGTSVKVEVVKVDGFIASPNVTTMLAEALTPVAPLAGFVDTHWGTGGIRDTAWYPDRV
jgi:hypothetical protein